MSDIGRITVFAVVTALCAVVVRRQSTEIAVVLAMVGVVAILGYSLSMIAGIKAVMESLMEVAGISPLVAAPVIKTVGVAILTRFGAEVCRDAGENGLAVGVEVAGSVAALGLAAPLLQVVLDMISELL